MPQLPPPILFHPLKHHSGYIRQFMQEAISAPEQQLQEALRTIGSSQLDLYTGPLTPNQIAAETILYLQHHGWLCPKNFRQYLGCAGFQTLPLSDDSAWILRWGLADMRHVHLHPARHACHTMRVKANHLKTAVAAIVASISYKLPISLSLVNQVRVNWLNLPPVKSYTPGEGLGSIIELLL